MLIVTTSCQNTEEAEILAEDEFVDASDNGKIIPGQYIVTFNNSLKKELTGTYAERTEAMLSEIQIFLGEFTSMKKAPVIEQVYSTAIYGFTAQLDDEMVAALRADSRVKSVNPDRMMILKKPVDDGGTPDVTSQETPWGIPRVNGGVDATGKVAWIIDTGVDFDHPDLNVDVARSITFVRSRSADDIMDMDRIVLELSQQKTIL